MYVLISNPRFLFYKDCPDDVLFVKIIVYQILYPRNAYKLILELLSNGARAHNIPKAIGTINA